MDGKPTVDHPCPTVEMGCNYQPKKHQARAARKTKGIQKFMQYSPVEKKPNTEGEHTDFKGEVELKQTVENLNKSIEQDHGYIYVSDCVVNFVCPGCVEKLKVIYKLQLELEGLKTENALLQRKAAKGRNVVEKFLKTDAKIRTYTVV